eukprot:s84_g23.t1
MRFFLVLLVLCVIQDGFLFDTEATVSKTARAGQKPLVANSYKSSLAAAAYSSKDSTSQDGHLGPAQSFGAAMVLHQLQDHAQGPCGSLRPLWSILERCRRPKLCLQWWAKTAVPAPKWLSQCWTGKGSTAMGAAPQKTIQTKESGQRWSTATVQPPSAQRPRARSRQRSESQIGFASLPPPQPDPPWTSTATAMPAMPVPPLPPGPHVQQDPQLAELIAMISKNPDNCPPEVQAAFHALQARNAQKESKLLHSAVTQMTKAKQELADAQLHRSNLHSSWIRFLQESIAKWQECGKQFRDQEDAAVSRIKAAQTSYTTACDALNCSKREAGVAGAEEVVDVEEMDLSGVSTVNTTKISESLAHLQTSLSELHQSAEELAEQESHAAKRPRTEAVPPDQSVEGSSALPGANSSLPKSKAMEPFGAPDQR